MKPLLSILIPTVVGREVEFNRLKTRINNIFLTNNIKSGTVECRVLIDNKELTVGEKRERLYAMAIGDYVWQIDDDDDISDDSIILILRAIKQKPDCITFQEKCVINGVEYRSNHSMLYDDWEGDGQRLFDDGFHYHRTPFMKSVIKATIAKKVPVPHLRYGEDHEWAKKLHQLLQTEVHIDSDIYFYQHTSSNHNERYGII